MEANRPERPDKERIYPELTVFNCCRPGRDGHDGRWTLEYGGHTIPLITRGIRGIPVPAPLKQTTITSPIRRWPTILAHAGMHALAGPPLQPDGPQPPSTPTESTSGAVRGAHRLRTLPPWIVHRKTGHYKNNVPPHMNRWGNQQMKCNAKNVWEKRHTHRNTRNHNDLHATIFVLKYISFQKHTYIYIYITVSLPPFSKNR